MTLKMDFQVTGLQATLENLDALPKVISDRLLDNAMAAGARVVGAEIRRRAPVQSLQKTGVVSGRRAAKKMGIRYKGSSRVAGLAFVAIRQPKSRLAHLFEFGTVPRKRKNGASTGRMIARPFMRPAADAAAPMVLEKVKTNLAKGLKRETAKLYRKGKF